MKPSELGKLPPLAQLHAFVTLAEELHFGRAAARLGIAQPPLSQQIRRLEDRVGHTLFNRSAAGVTLTPAGRELLPAARRTLTGLADGLTAARAAGDGRTGRLRVGFAASLALTVLPDLLRTHRDRLPGVELQHRGDQIRTCMHQRAGYRNRRRSANLRYRARRSHNRTTRPGWLPPSLRHRVDTTFSLANRLCR